MEQEFNLEKGKNNPLDYNTTPERKKNTYLPRYPLLGNNVVSPINPQPIFGFTSPVKNDSSNLLPSVDSLSYSSSSSSDANRYDGVNHSSISDDDDYSSSSSGRSPFSINASPIKPNGFSPHLLTGVVDMEFTPPQQQQQQQQSPNTFDSIQQNTGPGKTPEWTPSTGGYKRRRTYKKKNTNKKTKKRDKRAKSDKTAFLYVF